VETDFLKINKLMTSQREKDFLAAIILIEKFSKMLATVSYIWGGLSIDIYKRQFLREHSDIDYFVRDLQRISRHLQDLLLSEGWTVVAILNNHLLVAIKDNVKLHLGHIEVDDVVKWKHNGNDGTITFPVSWLSENPVDFYGLKVHVVEPEFEYVIKSNPNLMNPKWTSRNKDRVEIEMLEDILVQRGVDNDSLISRMTTGRGWVDQIRVQR